MTVRVWLSPQAHVQALRVDDWWRANRPAARGLFADELDGAFQSLAESPGMGQPYASRRVPGVRRLLLPATRHHVYYVYDESTGNLDVLAVWSAVRRRGPPLKR